MSLWKPRSISAKLTQTIVLVVGIALLLAYVSFLAYDFYTLQKNLVSSLDTEAGIIGSNCVTALMFDDSQAAENTLSALRGSPHISSAVVLQSNGKVFARYARDARAPAALDDTLKENQLSAYWRQDGRILFGHRIVFQNRTVGFVYLFAETTDVSHRARQFGLISAAILVLCFLGSLFATSRMRNQVTQPLANLARTAQIVTHDHDYSIRADKVQRGDELALLVGSFNEMLEQIQQRDRALETSRAELEDRVRERTAQLTSANQELEAFSSAVAHDLRGPLQKVTNLAFLISETGDLADGTRSRELMEKITDATGRMSLLIDDLLNLSRASSTPLNRGELDLSSIATSVTESLRTENPERNVEFVATPGAHVHADLGLMTVVMENLLRNAWKYTSRREGARIEFGFESTAEGRVYFVSDNGVGFDPQYLSRLFHPFQRLHSETDFPGTGVGLATVQRIIARHGGKVWAEGQTDRGARFSFTIPE
jgi:signal transduction histidine kinase